MRKAIIDIVIINVIIIRDMSWEGDIVKNKRRPFSTREGFFYAKIKDGTK